MSRESYVFFLLYRAKLREGEEKMSIVVLSTATSKKRVKKKVRSRDSPRREDRREIECGSDASARRYLFKTSRDSRRRRGR